MAVFTFLVLVAYFASTFAYIPAQASNQTNVSQAGRQNTSDTSRISLRWYPQGSYSETVSYQLVGADSSGISEGVLLHFSEDRLSNEITSAPWIALVSCDTNSTDASLEDDVFTLARDRGAVAALLYSTTSEACYLNSVFSDPNTFDHVMDVYATQSRVSSLLIEQDFFHTAADVTYWFDPAVLNVSAAAIEDALDNRTASVPGFLFVTLTAFNASNAPPSSASGTASPPGQTTPASQSISSPRPGIPVDIIAVIVVVGVIACFCAVGLYEWIRKRSARSRRREASAPESEHDPPDTVGNFEAREAQPMAENYGGLVASTSRPALDSRRATSSRRTAFSPDRLVRPLANQPEFTILDTIEETKR